MNYLSKQAVRYSLCRMSKFHAELVDLFGYHGMDLLDNLGRRNILMSQAMEQFVAEEMQDDLGEFVICDGHTGHADIVIPHLNKELECKLNSRYKGRSHSLQCDWETLGRKGSLDFLYFVTDAPFENFAALHFSDLTQDDFHPPSPGARNKSRMRLDRAMARCEILHGDGLRINEIELDKILSEMNHRSEIHQVRLDSLRQRLEVARDGTKKRENLKGMIDREINRHNRIMEKLRGREEYWNAAEIKWTFNLKPV